MQLAGYVTLCHCDPDNRVNSQTQVERPANRSCNHHLRLTDGLFSYHKKDEKSAQRDANSARWL